MSSPILQALPTIHVSVIAIGLTIFVGFAIIAYQDFIKLKLSLLEAKKVMIAMQTPNQKLPSDNESGLYLDGHALDWKGKAWPRLKDFRGFHDPFAEQDVKKQARDMCQIFYLFLTTYPMLGQEVISDALSENIWNKKNLRYGLERHDLCGVRLSELSNFIERYRAQLLEIAKKCDRLEVEERRKMFDEAAKEIKFPIGYSHLVPTFGQAQADYSRWEEGVVYYLDLIKKLFISHNQFRPVFFDYENGLKNYYIRTLRSPLTPIVGISLVFTFGILLPPIIETIRGDSRCWYPALDYLMLITCIPYYYFLWVLARNSHKFFNDK